MRTEVWNKKSIKFVIFGTMIYFILIYRIIILLIKQSYVIKRDLNLHSRFKMVTPYNQRST